MCSATLPDVSGVNPGAYRRGFFDCGNPVPIAGVFLIVAKVFFRFRFAV
jgi:hypothetical protein